jgi:hypothetical protein
MPILLNQIQKDALIQLYAENNISELDNQPNLIKLIFGGIDGINSFTDIEKVISDYKEFTIELRTIKKNLEEIDELFPKIQSRIRYCLIQLLNVVEEGKPVKIDIFNKMVGYRFLTASWVNSDELIKKYNEISAIIQTWNHFFVSYTTRDAEAINSLYKPELFDQFTPEILKTELTQKNNLLAKFIVKCLKKYNSLKVFFDRESIVCGDIIKDEVYEYCEKTFAFIQLIEDITFNSEQDNWCYNEYERFSSLNDSKKKSKHFFLIDGLTIDADTVPAPYHNWAQDIVDTKFEKIYKPFDVISIKKKCKEFADRIKIVRLNHINELIKAVA